MVRCIRLLICAVYFLSSLWYNHRPNVNFSPVASCYADLSLQSGAVLPVATEVAWWSQITFTCFSYGTFSFVFNFERWFCWAKWSELASVFFHWSEPLTFKGYTADSAVILTAHISIGLGPSPLQHPLSFLGSVPSVLW